MKKVCNFVFIILVNFMVIPNVALSDIGLRLYDGDKWITTDEPFSPVFTPEPQIVFGVYCDYSGVWSGKIIGNLKNGQLSNYSNVWGVISKSSSGYDMVGNTYGNHVVNFLMEADVYEVPYVDHILLYDNASVFDVPVDTYMAYVGGWPGFDDAAVTANSGGVYLLAEGGTVTFNASGSTKTRWYYDDPYEPFNEMSSDTEYISTEFMNEMYWSINGVDIAYGLNPEISYDTLVDGLNLEPGVYDLKLSIKSIEGSDTDFTTIQIVPEPVSVFTMLCGGTLLLKRNRR